MNLPQILSENSFLNPLLEKAIKDRKELIKFNRLVNFASLLVIGVIVIGVSIGIIASFSVYYLSVNYNAETVENSFMFSPLMRFIFDNSYMFIYGGLILGFLINYMYAKPLSAKRIKFQELEQESIRSIMKVVYPGYEFESTHYANKNHTFELSKIFGWKGKQHVSYKIYGSLENKQATIKTTIYDVGVNKYAKTPSFLYYIPYINIIYFYSGHSIKLLKNIFSRSTPESNLNNFRGLYTIGEFPKKLKGYTVVLPKSIESQFQQWNINKQEKVELEDLRFTNQFLVYSTDQVEARYVISTSMMEKIVAFKKKAKLPIMLAFVENKIHIAIENKDGVFSIPTAKKEAIEVLKEITDEVEVSLDIVQDFRLSRRIFG